MMHRQLVLLLSLWSAVGGAAGAFAQEASRSSTADGPRFLLATASAMVPVDVQRMPVLRQRVSLDVVDGSIEAAFAELTRQTGVHFVYSTDVVPPGLRVRVRVQDVTMAAALSALLTGAEVDVVVPEAGGTLIVRPRERDGVERPKAAEPGTIEGFVREKGTGTPVVHAEVAVEGGGSVLTNESGFYRILKVPPGRRRVTASSIGYAASTQEVEVGDGATVRLDFVLEIAPTRLAEIVTTVTGKQRLVELGNDVTVLNVDSIVKTEPVATVTEILEGRVPGLVVQRASGAPGDPARIRIRGVSSPRLSNDPIIIVDGVRVYSGLSDERAENLATRHLGSARFPAPSPLDQIDPHTIETIQVIKGPSATTLYGQDAANGVIVITTKKGKEGPPRWTASVNYGTTEIPRDFPELYLRWGRLFTDDTRVFCPIDNRVRSGYDLFGVPCQPDDSVVVFQMLNDPEFTVLDRGYERTANVGVSGGRGGLTYALNASYGDRVGVIVLPKFEVARYLEEQGMEPPEWMRRPQRFTHWSVSSRITAQLGSRASVALSSELTRSDQQRSGLEMDFARLMSTYVDPVTGTYYEVGGVGGVKSPTDELLWAYRQRVSSKQTHFRNALAFNWQPATWLTASANAGLDVIQRSDEHFAPGREALEPGGRLDRGNGTSVVGTMNAHANMHVPLGLGFQFRLATGINYVDQSIHDMMSTVDGLVPGTESVNGAARIQSLSENLDDRATFGWFIEPGISHRRLWISTGLRMDGGSTFGARLKLPSFPKLSVSYLISDEPFFPDALRSIFTTLRLRAAYGHAGRQPGPVDRLRLYSVPKAEWLNGEYVSTVQIQTLGNTELKPERSREFEGGFDADLFDDRINVTFTGYRKTTKDALVSVPVAPSVYGDFVRQLRNIGVVLNEGMEVSLAVEPARGDLLTWRAQLNWSQNSNEVVELGPGVEPFYTGGGGDIGTRVVPGYPLFGRWSRPVLGYTDANGNGVLEEGEVLLGDTAVYVGSTLPKYTASLQNTFSLLRGLLSVSVSLLYEDGMTQFNEVKRRLAPFSWAWNDPSSTIEDQVAVFDRTPFTSVQTVNSLRLNSLSVRFALPSQVARRLGAQAMSIQVQGTNLGLWTNYSGLDPNVTGRLAGSDVTDPGRPPRPRVWQVRVDASY